MHCQNPVPKAGRGLFQELAGFPTPKSSRALCRELPEPPPYPKPAQLSFMGWHNALPKNRGFHYGELPTARFVETGSPRIARICYPELADAPLLTCHNSFSLENARALSPRAARIPDSEPAREHLDFMIAIFIKIIRFTRFPPIIPLPYTGRALANAMPYLKPAELSSRDCQNFLTPHRQNSLPWITKSSRALFHELAEARQSCLLGIARGLYPELRE